MVAIVTVLGIATATAAPDLLSTVPEGSKTVTDWYKQTVYDRHDAKIGAIDDVLVDKSGKVTALMVGVGGFLGIGEKDVAVPFEAVRVTKKSNDLVSGHGCHEGRSEKRSGATSIIRPPRHGCV